MSDLSTKLLTDTWLIATWDEYIQLIKDTTYEKAKSYYYKEQLRIEMPPVGLDHADDNGIITILVYNYGIAKGLRMRLKVNCSYRKRAIREAQPDVSYYIGERVQFAPTGSSIVDLDHNQPPDLVIEISDTSLSDDLGAKRILYQDLAVS